MAAALLLLPPSFPGCRWEPGADGGLSPGRAPRARGAQRPMSEGGRGNCCGGPRARGRRAPRLPRSPPLGEAATGAISRAARGSGGGGCCAPGGRREGGGRAGRGGRGGRRVAARVPGRRPRGRPWPGEASTTSAGSAAVSDPAPNSGSHAGTRRPHCWAGPREPVADGHGDGRGLEAPPDPDRRLPRRGKPPSGPGPDRRPIPAAYPGLGAQVWLSTPVIAEAEGLLAGERTAARYPPTEPSPFGQQEQP
ncbi:rho-related GTP-binding protein RhoF isoform X1 [Ailuropoda melanoleuca]|uniref:rho-related GTP-binding protein RhoF isoform X1 n=1 Tax=Ailuropoda melanoleuca TaxID=9646 RepID=UPI001494BB83|nr:rho-related GTP-binding protein RhoF isoform X1 [Ailuropoda melanoleuca]XP_034493815.1 rho-related GTP-binding protein RhoF isoform X1 [Ailuropoda melanoleuca]XP_034493816.1 rho-related GTP-binding protein RhoF isoform X1 [Ailuropoda melanoleuca]XP_034493822.1 rho-related GTP-binding protein RhoF isoform X1 [Ailuropoda melanoleuca]